MKLSFFELAEALKAHDLYLETAAVWLMDDEEKGFIILLKSLMPYKRVKTLAQVKTVLRQLNGQRQHHIAEGIYQLKLWEAV